MYVCTYYTKIMLYKYYVKFGVWHLSIVWIREYHIMDGKNAQ